MMRYAAIPWPLAGLFIALALVGQEMLLTALGSNPSLVQTAYRMLVWTVGITSLALLLLPPRRLAYLLGAIVCAGADGLGAVAAVRTRARPLSAVRLPARRRHRDRDHLPDRRDPQSAAPRAPRSMPD